MHARLKEDHPGLSILELFQYPTVSGLAAHLGDAKAEDTSQKQRERSRDLASGRKALMQRRRIRR